MYASFIQELENLRGRTARFRRVALHLHSPDSHDWGTGATDASRSERSRFSGDAGLDEYIAELRPHLDLVAITDHMKSGFASRCSQRVTPNDEFLVLPGMEVNLRLEPPLGFARIHLLTILPEGSTPEAFARLMFGQSQIPADSSRTGNEEVTGLNLTQWVERVHNENGICIAAHVENSQGVRMRFRQVARETLKLFSKDDEGNVERENLVPDNFREYILSSGLDAVEIHQTDHVQHYRWVSTLDGRQKWVACTLTFDAHNVDQFDRADRVTHIKMTRLGLDGLRQALRIPDTRIRFHDSLPTPPNPRLLGLHISGNEDSFFEDITVAFAENLTCIIGVRGSGKSTIVEALRYIFGYNRSLGDLDKLQGPIKELQRANLTGCIIRLAYQTSSGDVRVLNGTYDEKSDYVTQLLTLDGQVLEIPDVEVCGDYPLRLFGWSEIEMLGREPSKQRDLLDRLIPDLGELLSRRDALRSSLVENRGVIEKHIQAVIAAYRASNNEIRRFKEYKADFERLNTDAVKDLFQALDLVKDKQRVLATLASNSNRASHGLTDHDAVSLDDDLSSVLEGGVQALRDWWHEEESPRLNIAGVQLEVRNAVQQAIERIRSFAALVEEHKSVLQQSREQVEQELRARFAEDDSMQRIADLRQNAEQRLRKVTEIREQYLKAWKELINALETRKGIAIQLARAQSEIAGVRARHNENVETTLNRFLPNWMNVTIDLRPGRDTSAFHKRLYDLFGARGNQVKRIRSVVESNKTPIEFAEMIYEGSFESLVGMTETPAGGASDSFSSEDASICITRTQPFEQDDAAEVTVFAEDGGRLNVLLDLQETTWEDHEAILLNGAPVNEKSPGQRSSAMLPLIALAEATPLVIDQPEDNLDKRLVGTVLMNVLAELKEKRQIIVCTHDPNILVGGDAEQVVVLEAKSDRKGAVEEHGSIDNEDIVTTVVDILEGGAEAFEKRRQRYGFS